MTTTQDIPRTVTEVAAELDIPAAGVHRRRLRRRALRRDVRLRQPVDGKRARAGRRVRRRRRRSRGRRRPRRVRVGRLVAARAEEAQATCCCASPQLIATHAEELALLETLDMGKPIRDARNVDMPLAADCIHWYGEAIDKIYDEVAPTDADRASC